MDFDLDAMILQLQQVQISKQIAAGGFAIYAFDILLTLEDEKKYIWQAKWSVSKGLYLAVRWPWFIITIFTLITALSSPSPATGLCHAFWYFEAFLGTIELGLVQYILALRTRALFAGDNRIGNLLLLLPILCTGAMITLNGIYASHMRFLENPFPGLMTGCYRNCINCSTWYRLFYVPMILFDGIIFWLTVHKAWQHARKKVSTPLLTVLYRDGFLYFVVMFACTLVNLIIWNLGQDALLEIMVFLLRCLSSVMTCRLVLNLRGTVSCPLKEDSSSKASDEDAHPIAIVMNTFMGVGNHHHHQIHHYPSVNVRGQSSTQGVGNVLHTLNQNETLQGASFSDPNSTLHLPNDQKQDLENAPRSGDDSVKPYSSRSMDTEDDDDDDDDIIFHRPQFPPGTNLGRNNESVGSIPPHDIHKRSR